MTNRLYRWIIALSLFSSVMLPGCVVEDPQVVVPTGPPQEGFRLGPEDIIDVVVWRNPDLTRESVVIRPDGKISMPLIGDVQASGLTAEELAQSISERYKAFKENPAVSVSVKEINSYSIFVLGEVKTPGKYPLKSYTTVLQAISMAGGFTEFASRNAIQVVRKITTKEGKHKEIRIPVQYDALLSESGADYNFILRPGDTIVVP
ncbi:MAG: sugar ABC transporter substrate-binding protein [Nitrospirae bacterium]|nr:MAG: sugar ABC transporter substrate-binding protein [Nitrospirota bacterium]